MRGPVVAGFAPNMPLSDSKTFKRGFPMNNQQSSGVCGFCGVRKGEAAMTTHLQQCLPRAANGGRRVPLLLLGVQAAYAPMYWLHVAAGRDGNLRRLDDLLRHVWLECCGHMSKFYTTGRQEISMNRGLSQVFASTGDRINHVYDFGTSTEVVVSLVGLTEGTSVKPVVASRNEPPIWPCDVCGEPASNVCSECYDGGFCCVRHAGDHNCGEDMLLPVVNSPRMGVCGYTG